MLIPSGEGEGMENSQLVTQGNFNSPSRGLAVVVKKRIPTTRGSASCGRNLFFTTPAKPWLGELKLPFVTRWEFIIPTTRGFATRGRNYTIPSPPPEGITSMQVFIEIIIRFIFYFLFSHSVLDSYRRKMTVKIRR